MDRTTAASRSGFTHISSMMAVCEKPQSTVDVDSVVGEPPWKWHAFVTCKHPNTRVRLKRFDTGDRACKQCVDCGRRVGQWVAKANIVELFDEELLKNMAADYEDAQNQFFLRREFVQQQAKQDQSSRWWDAYSQYLKTAVWAVKRQKVLERCGGVCECCGQREATQVHHLEYPQVFGYEPLWTLRGICVPCHKIIHPHMK